MRTQQIKNHFILLCLCFSAVACAATPEDARVRKPVPTLGSVPATETAAESAKPPPAAPQAQPTAPVVPSADLVQSCTDWLGKLPDNTSVETNQKICKQAQQLEGCQSHEGVPIVHFNRPGQRANPEKILVFGLIHGDEYPSGSVARAWVDRLQEIDPRNEWRLIPILNPDGMKRKTRVNGRGVDLNRNFPSADWDELAEKYWKTKTNSDPRRAPGPQANSEIETQCAIKHIEEFKPDLIISIHTPYGVLDFDGPKLSFPEFKGLPWVSLGTFPGSLGRYMWTDRKVPVLTIELKHDLKTALSRFDELQDISGQVALKIKRYQ